MTASSWKLLSALLLGVSIWAGTGACPAAEEEVLSIQEQQVKDKQELMKIKNELGDVKFTMTDAMKSMSQAEQQVSQAKNIKEFHLVPKQTSWELFPGTTIQCWAYNNQVPGPAIRVHEGDAVRVVVHNELPVPTSLHFHGLQLPHAVDGLPRQNAGLIGVGETYVYQFIAGQPGTYWYHPQVIHSEQQMKGLHGAIVVEPRQAPKSVSKDEIMILGQWPALIAPGPIKQRPLPGAKAVASPPKMTLLSGTVPPDAMTFFTVNGKSAPAIPALEVRKGQRVRLRLINAGQQACPLHLSGHRFQIVSINGSSQERSAAQDSLALQPGDRVDLEFVADNPGVWSLASLLPHQSTNRGKFPGGIACVVRYADFTP